ncbi:MAG TPA: hypothetical protein VFQ75_02360 [Candidatus Limnocylindrales bacterium]|nr:hypothetical protein [Candidatus Limnocylindrales bacterium]
MSTRSLHAPRPVRPLAAGLALAALLAACTGGGSGAPAAVAPGAPSAAAPSPAATGAPSHADADTIDHPTGATDIVLRVGEEGGFMMMEAVMSRVPAFTLYGDGRVIVAQVPAAKGEAGLNGVPQQELRESRLTEAQVQDLLHFAIFDGMLGVSKEEFPVLVMDIPTTVFQLHAGGIDKTVKVAGIGMDPPPGPDAATLKALAQLAERLGSITGDAAYVAPASVAILAETQPAPGSPVADWPWPDLAPAGFVAPPPNDPFGFTSHLLTDAEATAIGIENGGSAAPTTYRASDGKAYVVVVRPALPEEAAAAG